MLQLNFKPYQFQIKNQNNRDYIFDVVRKKYVILTPEEWVRQHVIKQLNENGYPYGLMSLEKSLPNSKKRYDVVVYNKLGKPTIIVECKRPTVTLNQSILNQVAAYVSQLDIPKVILTNGMHHFTVYREKSEMRIEQGFPLAAHENYSE